MGKVVLACIGALTVALMGSAMSISGEWSTSILFGPNDSSSFTTLSLSTSLSSWDLSSTSVLTADGLHRQELSFAHELGELNISGGVTFSPSPKGDTTFRRADDALAWKGSGLDLEEWTVSLELSLERLTIGLTITQRPDR